MIDRWALRWLARLAALTCAGVAVWAVWTEALAQTANTNTNTNSTPPPNSLTAATRALERVVPGREFIERNRSTLSFGLDRIEMFQFEIFTKPLWQYLASFAYMGLAFAASKAVDRFINLRLKAWAAHTKTQWDDIVIHLLDGPVKVVVFVLLLHIGLQIFDWPVWLRGGISKFTLIILFISVAYVLLKAVDALVGVAKTRLAEGLQRTVPRRLWQGPQGRPDYSRFAHLTSEFRRQHHGIARLVVGPRLSSRSRRSRHSLKPVRRRLSVCG